MVAEEWDWKISTAGTMVREAIPLRLETAGWCLVAEDRTAGASWSELERGRSKVCVGANRGGVPKGDEPSIKAVIRNSHGAAERYR